MEAHISKVGIMIFIAMLFLRYLATGFLGGCKSRSISTHLKYYKLKGMTTEYTVLEKRRNDDNAHPRIQEKIYGHWFIMGCAFAYFALALRLIAFETQDDWRVSVIFALLFFIGHLFLFYRLNKVKCKIRPSENKGALSYKNLIENLVNMTGNFCLSLMLYVVYLVS